MTEHIKINDVAPRVQYIADGAQVAFPFAFAIFKDADLEVYLADALQAEGFSITGAGISAGGTLTFDVAPPADALVTLRRRLAVQRLSDFQEGGAFRAKVINDEMDYQAAASQQIADDVGRAVKRSATSSSSADLTLPEPVAGRALKWNEAGTGLEVSDFDPDAASDAALSAQTAQVAAEAAQGAAETARDQSAVSAAAAADSAASAEAAAASNLFARVEARSASFAVALADDGTLFQIDASAAPVTVSLGEIAALGDGFRVGLARLDGTINGVTVQAGGGDLYVDGTASFGLNVLYDTATVIADLDTARWTKIVNPDDTTLLRSNVGKAVSAGYGAVGGTLTYGGTVTPNFANGNFFDLTATGNFTLNFPTLLAGQGKGIMAIDVTASGTAVSITLGAGLAEQGGDGLVVALGKTQRVWLVLKSAVAGHVYAEELT